MRLPTIIIDSTSDAYTYKLKFRSTENCQITEPLIADVFAPGATTKTATVSTGAATGKPKGEWIEDVLNFDGIGTGEWYLKVFTNDTGVLAKAIVVIK